MTTDVKRERIERAAIAALPGLLDTEAASIEDPAMAKRIAQAAVRYATALIDALDASEAAKPASPPGT